MSPRNFLLIGGKPSGRVVFAPAFWFSEREVLKFKVVSNKETAGILRAGFSFPPFVIILWSVENMKSPAHQLGHSSVTLLLTRRHDRISILAAI